MTLSTMLQRKAYQAASAGPAHAKRTQWLMRLAVDAMELTRIESYDQALAQAELSATEVVARAEQSANYEPGLGMAEEADTAPERQSHVLPEARLRNLRATPLSQRPALRVPKGQRKEYTAAMAAVEWLGSAALGEVKSAKKEDAQRIRALLSMLGKDQELIPQDCRDELHRLAPGSSRNG